MLNFCPNCGIKIEEEWKACPYCGHNLQSERGQQSFQQPTPPTPPTAPIPPYPQQYTQPTTIIYPPKHNNTYGIVALIFGFLGLFILPFIGSIVAIIVGAIGRKNDDSPEMATGGLVLGIIGLLCWAIGIFFIVSFIMSMFSGMYYPPI
jgi:hypothetical protein